MSTKHGRSLPNPFSDLKSMNAVYRNAGVADLMGPEIFGALLECAEDIEKSPTDALKAIVEEWLVQHGYLPEEDPWLTIADSCRCG